MEVVDIQIISSVSTVTIVCALSCLALGKLALGKPVGRLLISDETSPLILYNWSRMVRPRINDLLLLPFLPQ